MFHQVFLIVNLLKLPKNHSRCHNALTVFVVLKVMKVSKCRDAPESILHWCIPIEIRQNLIVVHDAVGCSESWHPTEMPRSHRKDGVQQMGVATGQ